MCIQVCRITGVEILKAHALQISDHSNKDQNTSEATQI